MVFSLLPGALRLFVMTVLWIRQRQWSRLLWGWVCSACAGGVAGARYACNSEASPQAKARIEGEPKLPQLSAPGDASVPNLLKLTRDYPQLQQEYLQRCLYAEAVNPDFQPMCWWILSACGMSMTRRLAS